ncbi:MAG: NAD(P)H-dependent oxidoreductase [Bacteroidota bacterium]
MKIAIVVGSIREGRQSHKIALYLKNLLLSREGIHIDYLDLEKHELPLLADRWQNQQPINERLQEASNIFNSADALIFVSPEYHGSYTGVLKNAVDHFWGEFSKKVIGVVVTGSGKFGGINASHQLQHLILSLGAYPMPKKLIIPYIQKAFNEGGSPIDNDLAKDCSAFLDEFIWFAQAVSSAKKELSLKSQA